MDWDLAIQRNSEALNGIIDTLFAMLGLAGGATVLRISQPLYRAVLRVLRPAESAVRRLIVIAARGLVAKVAPSRPVPKGRVKSKAGTPRPSFQLFDPRKDFACLDQYDHRTLRNLRASISSGAIPGCRPCGPFARPWPIPLRRLMVLSMPHALAAGYMPSPGPLTTCRTRRAVLPAGGCGRPAQKLISPRVNALVVSPATTQPCAICCIQVPSMEIVSPAM